MEKLKLLKGDFACKLSLALAPTIKAGFPSPADDYLHDSLDFNRDLIKNPEATFYGRVSGDSMIEAGICNGDIAVIDRSLEPADGFLLCILLIPRIYRHLTLGTKRILKNTDIAVALQRKQRKR